MTHDPRHDAQMLALLRQRRRALRAAGLPVTATTLSEAMALEIDPPHVERLAWVEDMRQTLAAERGRA